MNEESVINLLFEFGHLRRIKREGWRLLGLEDPESVADHSLRAAQVGYLLAVMEGYSNPMEVCTMLVFHDIGECRVGDIHKVANRYIECDETQAVKDQLAPLGEHGAKLLSLWGQVEDQKTIAGQIAKDADLLELALKAKEYMEQGYSGAQEWLDAATKFVKTESAKTLVAKIPQMSSTAWWNGLKKF